MEYFVLQVPRWTGKLLFDYDSISFFIVVFMLLVCLALSFWGYKYMMVLLMCFIGSIFAKIALPFTGTFTSNDVIWMALFVTLTFLCEVLLLLLLHMAASRFRNLEAKFERWKKFYGASALVGTSCLAVVVYLYVYRNILILLLGWVVVSILAVAWCRRQSKKNIIFYTYDDIADRTELTEMADQKKESSETV